jgi:hypothetical protein
MDCGSPLPLFNHGPFAVQLRSLPDPRRLQSGLPPPASPLPPPHSLLGILRTDPEPDHFEDLAEGQDERGFAIR